MSWRGADLTRPVALRPTLVFSNAPIQTHPGRDVIGLIDRIKGAAEATHPLLRRMKHVAPSG